MCVISVIIIFVLSLGTHTHFLFRCLIFKYFTKVREEARLGLVLVTESCYL